MFRISLAICLLALLVMAVVTEFPWLDRMAVSAGEKVPPEALAPTGSLVVEVPTATVIPIRGEVKLSLTPRGAGPPEDARELSTHYPDGPAAAASGILVESSGRRFTVDDLAAGSYEVTLELADRDAPSDAAAYHWEGAVTVEAD